MKCPKCGSENLIVEKSINGFSTCQDCGYRWQHGMKQPDPSTAEKLLLLARNNYEVKTTYKNKSYGIVVYPTATSFNWFYNWYGTLDEAIKAAYEWAKKQEEQND